MIVVPSISGVYHLTKILNEDILLKLYSNDLIPIKSTTLGSLDEVVGGGYESRTLTTASKTITIGNPVTGLYPVENFLFTGVTVSPGTVYGYYIVTVGGTLLWAERFPESVLPFSPGSGSMIRITPRVQLT